MTPIDKQVLKNEVGKIDAQFRGAEGMIESAKSMYFASPQDSMKLMFGGLKMQQAAIGKLLELVGKTIDKS